MIKCKDCKFNNTDECDIMACDALDELLDELNKRLIDCKEEINDINKILDYCSNWTDRLELEMSNTNDILRRGLDVIGEEYTIIDEMVNLCNNRIDELKHELTDIRGWLSRYGHGDYDEGGE
jgi:chromosome segregation ATPase